MDHYVLLTNIDEPFKTESIYRGKIIVKELKVWPGWKEHSGVIATYQWKSQPNTGEPVDADKTAFYNTPNIYLTCRQVNSNTFVDSQKAETVLTGTPFDDEAEVTSFESSNPTPFHAPVSSADL